LGKFLKAHDINRESVVILTKTFNPDAKAEDLGPAGLINHRGSSRKVRPDQIYFTCDEADELEDLRLGPRFFEEASTRIYRCLAAPSI
jgi:aryl-alcohol dehydrogenase-like predicted oxidoreductase